MANTSVWVDPDRINALKARVKAECIRRNMVGSVAQYASESNPPPTGYDFTVIPEWNENHDSTDESTRALTEHAWKNLVPLNAINSKKFPSTTGERVITSKDLDNAELFLDVAENRAVNDHQNTDCSSGCTGLCYGCQADCWTGCYTGCSGCKGSCSGSCSGGCKTGCGDACKGCTGCTSCTNSCDDACTCTCGNCGCRNGCHTSCTNGCDNGCGGNCSFCSTNCHNVCTTLSAYNTFPY